MDQHFDSIAIILRYIECFQNCVGQTYLKCVMEIQTYNICIEDFLKLWGNNSMSTQSYSEIENCYVCIQNTNVRDLVSV